MVGMQKKMQGDDENTSPSPSKTSSAAQLTREEALTMLKDDYDNNYFVSTWEYACEVFLVHDTCSLCSFNHVRSP